MRRLHGVSNAGLVSDHSWQDKAIPCKWLQRRQAEGGAHRKEQRRELLVSHRRHRLAALPCGCRLCHAERPEHGAHVGLTVRDGAPEQIDPCDARKV